MSMRTLVILIITTVMEITTLYAQTNYYTESKIFEGVGYKYKCNVSSSKSVILYSCNNKLTGQFPKYKATGGLFSYPAEGVKLYQYNAQLEKQIRQVVHAAFSKYSQPIIVDKSLYIIFYINSESGSVDELEFEFVNFGPYSQIPIDVYREIENRIKDSIHFEITEFGKTLNFVWTSREVSSYCE